MIHYSVRKYQAEDKQQWDLFIENSVNGTFLLKRDFMEYHSDRFEDYSLIIEKENKIIAVFPANINSNVLHSHQGLTYGGMIYNEELKLEKIIAAYYWMLDYLNSNQIFQIELKCIPIIYHQKITQAELYIMFLLQATNSRRDTLAVIDLSQAKDFKNNARNSVKVGIKKAISHQLVVKEDNDFTRFWEELLTENLQKKHQAKPVHTLEEITLLQQKFPENIKHYNVYYQDKLVAGTTIFETDHVAHSQYIASSDDRSQLGSLEFLHEYLLHEKYKSKRYFDFGISNENQGKKLNFGLSYWKESFGSHIIVQDFYSIQTQNLIFLKQLFND